MDKFVVKSRRDLTVDNSHAHCDDACTSSDYSTDTLLAVTDELKVSVERFCRNYYIRRGSTDPTLASYPETVFSGRRRSFQRNWFESRCCILFFVQNIWDFESQRCCIPSSWVRKLIYGADPWKGIWQAFF